MTVEELINTLKDYPQDGIIYWYNEYGDAVTDFKIEVESGYESQPGEKDEVSITLDFWI